MRALNRVITSSLGPFNSTTQIRWRGKPTTSARTRLETRTKDFQLDLLTRHIRRLKLILSLHHLFCIRNALSCISVQRFSRWAPRAGLNTLALPAGYFLTKYPHFFHRFKHPIKKTEFVKFTSKFLDLLRLEKDLLSSEEIEKLNVLKIKRILLMSVNGNVRLRSIKLLRAELGLPDDFRESVIKKYDQEFRLVCSDAVEFVELVDSGEGSDALRVAEVEKWRRKEFEDKWLPEFEVKYAFPMDFPSGFTKGPGFKLRLKDWQRLEYVKAYEPLKLPRMKTRYTQKQYEKRAVGIIHEILWLTVDKRMEVERLLHFRKDLGFLVNIRELLLRHPGIFYISIRGNNQTLFLREAYHKGYLIEPNPIYDIRMKMLDLVLLKRYNSRSLLPEELPEEVLSESRCQRTHTSPRVDDLVIRYLSGDTNREGSKEESSKNIGQRTNTRPRVGDFVIKILGSDTNHEGSKEE